MKQIITIYFLLIIIFLGLCGSCSQAPKKETNTGRVYFTINPNDRKILLPVVLNDSITANLAFDSGGSFTLDSTFCATHPCITADMFPIASSPRAVAWSETRVNRLIYKSTPTLKIGNTNLTDNYMSIFNWKWFMGNPTSDGLFNIPHDDTTHVWELNFERNYMEIHLAKYFRMPENCFVAPMTELTEVIRRDSKILRPCIKLPIKIKCADGDTLTLYRSYQIDTGIPWDIVLTRKAKENVFFNKQEDAIWSSAMGSYIRHYIVDGILFDNFKMDSLRIYTIDHDNRVAFDYLVGINFLKRFNVFFDMKNLRVGLQPIKNFQRVISPLGRRFHFSYARTQKNTLLVTKVADYKANYYKTAGLREGDEIVTINGKQYKWITRENFEEFRNQDTLLLNIIRKGESLKIVVPVNKNEAQGD